MNRTCKLVLAYVDEDTVCDDPGTGALTIGPRPFQYIDVCAKHLEVPVSDDVEILHRHPFGRTVS